jgi:hypothetical protein
MVLNRHERERISRGLPPIDGILGTDALHIWLAFIDYSAPAVYLTTGKDAPK